MHLNEHCRESLAYIDGEMELPAKARDIGYCIQEQALGTSKPIRVVGIGAGISGINLIRTLRLNLTNYECTIYEKNLDVGGTWLENRYPGCRCDIPSHNYQFSWRQNKRWSNFFSEAEEIHDYLCKTCDEEHMLDSIRLQHQVNDARWDEHEGVWRLKILDLQTGKRIDDYAHFLVNASGALNRWKWPDVEGLRDFKGELIHTASWPEDFDYKNKTVLVIGNGASGLQVLPTIQPDVKKLYHVVRTPTWITPPWRMLQSMMGGSTAFEGIELDEKENFTQAQIAKFETDPEAYRRFVKGVEKLTASNFPVMLKDGPAQAFATAKVTQYMTMMLSNDPRLCKTLIPDFPVGCRRIIPAPGYLEALRQPNVEVISGSIRKFVADGVELDSGRVIKVDAIICATGFDTSFVPRFPLVGRIGNLQDLWRTKTPSAYMSVAVAGLPNYFTFHGPNGPYGHGSLFTASEHVARYITRIIKKCQTQSIKAIAPSQAAIDDYAQHIATFMPRTTWASKGRSWFKGGNEDGPVTALHPGSRTHFFHMLEQVRFEDFEYVYEDKEGAAGNRFAYLGNGFSNRESEGGGDSTWYLDESGVLA